MTTATVNITREFLIAGNATFTVELPPGHGEKHGMKPHYTFLIVFKPADEKWPATYFCRLKTGPDRNDWSGFARLDPVSGEVRPFKRFAGKPLPAHIRLFSRAVKRIFDEDSDKITEAGWSVKHSGRCGKCGRELTTPESIDRGIGPVCFGKITEEIAERSL